MIVSYLKRKWLLRRLKEAFVGQSRRLHLQPPPKFRYIRRCRTLTALLEAQLI